MTAIATDVSETTFSNGATSSRTKRMACEEVGKALDDGGVGDIVAKHERLILEYYEDVKKQATESFKAAKLVALIGFAVLIVTWLYTLGFDMANFLPRSTPVTGDHRLAAGIGTITGALIEFIAGVNFWLYSKASKQFSAFHICLERTHRYLVAYKIGMETGSRKEIVLEHLVCIMASAPMIASHPDDSVQTPHVPFVAGAPNGATPATP